MKRTGSTAACVGLVKNGGRVREKVARWGTEQFGPVSSRRIEERREWRVDITHAPEARRQSYRAGGRLETDLGDASGQRKPMQEENQQWGPENCGSVGARPVQRRMCDVCERVDGRRCRGQWGCEANIGLHEGGMGG
jgi:hypothetical protein